MTDQTTAGSPQARPQPRARTLKGQGLVNRVVRGLLRTPLVSQAIGSKLVTLYITGRKSGRRYIIPVAYTRDEQDLLIGSPFGWARNLRTGEPVTIRLRGRLRQADVRAFSSEAEVVRLYAAMCRDNRNFAQFNKIALDGAGNPDPGDLHLAWLAGARAFRLTPR
jgi:deazaflavin-dependent oxidoreductase (nitroreductase family)